MVRGLVTVVVLAPIVAAAQPPGMTDAVSPSIVERGRDTGRAMIGVAAAMFANYPMSHDDPGVALFAAKPLWLGNRYRVFQWAAEASALAGFGTEYQHGYLALGARFGPNFYLGSVFGLEFRWGLEALAQVGPRTVGGFGMSGTGGYVFRFGDDDRKRLKLWLELHVGGYTASDPDNDVGLDASAAVVGLGYEEPL